MAVNSSAMKNEAAAWRRQENRKKDGFLHQAGALHKGLLPVHCSNKWV
jgi:hypothetical protein